MQPNYSYGYAKSTYDKLEQYEISMQVPPVKPEESLIVRLDGKGLTARFKSNTELFMPDFHLAMKRVMENIKKYFPFVTFAYSFKDEISLLLNKDQISHAINKCSSLNLRSPSELFQQLSLSCPCSLSARFSSFSLPPYRTICVTIILHTSF